MKIKNQTIVITGGASGLGYATAKHLQQLGAEIISIDCKPLKGESWDHFEVDITDESAMQSFWQNDMLPYEVRATINCAGIAPGAKVVGKDGPMILSDFKKVIDVNLIGTFNSIRFAAAAMSQNQPLEDNERGVIINTSSIAAEEGQIGQAAYSASKGGINGMTLPIARELANSGIRVNTIAPGLMGTNLLLNMPDKVVNSLNSQLLYPKRFGLPNEYAKLAEHIITNSYINGSIIRLDGGLRMT